MERAATSNVFRDAFVAKAKSVCSKADNLRKAGSPGVRGSLREILVAELLEAVLPPEVRVGTGQLVSHLNEMSSQIDVILYSPSIMVPALYDKKNGYFPIESCLYGFEVKTKITHGAMRESVKKARSISELSMVPTYHWIKRAEDGVPSSHLYGIPQPILGILAFSSDLVASPEDEIARYRELDPAADISPAITVICIRGRGYWFFDRKWQYIKANEDLSEIVLLLAGLSNTLPMLLVAKGRPRIGVYLEDSGEMRFDA